MTNERADWLREVLPPPQAKVLDHALAEERRLIVEQIGRRIREEANTFVGEIDLETVRSILDEVAPRPPEVSDE